MPCQYETPYERAARRSKDLDDRTRWLCAAMPFVENARALSLMEPEMREWWKAHKKADLQRWQAEEREAMKHKGVPMEEVP